MENEKIDQSRIAESVADKIPYEFIDFFLVKPMDPIKVKKEFTVPVTKDETPAADKNGVKAIDYQETKKEVKEVDSDWRKGIVIKSPKNYEKMLSDNEHNAYILNVKIGDTILFKDMSAKYFDLCKDTMLVRYYDILAIEK